MCVPKFYLACLLVATPIMSGCASFRELPSDRKVQIAEVLDQVECELHGALAGFAKVHPEYRESFIDKWAAAAALTLETSDEASINGGYLFGDPIIGGILKLTFGATASEKVRRIADFSVSFKLDDLVDRGCSNPAGADGREGLFFSNNTGAREWLERAATSLHDARNFPPDKLSHSLEFTIAANGEGKAGWTFIHSAPSFGARVVSQDLYQLKVAFAPIPGPARVHVVNFGDLQSSRPLAYSPRRSDSRTRGSTGRRLPPAPPEAQQLLNQQLFQLDLRSVLPRE